MSQPESTVQASFPNKDAKRSARIEGEILLAASGVGVNAASEGFDLTNRHLTFVMGSDKLSRFCDLVKSHCERLHLGHDEVKIQARIRI
jgi:hypothetical protein